MSSTMATAIVTTTTAQPVLQVGQCVACWESEGKAKDAKDMFKDVSMCEGCCKYWNDHYTLLTYQEWAAGWATTLDYYQAVSQELSKTVPVPVVAAKEVVTKKLIITSAPYDSTCKGFCQAAGFKPKVPATHCVDGVPLCWKCTCSCLSGLV